MSDKHTDTNWKPWVPKELTDWALTVEETTEDEKEVEKQEKEVVQQQKVLEQINMLDDMKDKA
ncbi:MAG: flagellar assembly protein FliH, partial [Proteus vulgaris]